MLSVVKRHMHEADEVWIAVAFLKNAGLALLINDFNKVLRKGGIINIIVGRDFFITEPEALNALLNVCREHDGSNLFLANEDFTFHPKMYRFVKGNTAMLMVGSANMTHGGLCNNIEVCMVNIVKIGSEEDNHVKRLFDDIVSEYSEIATPINVGRYEIKYNRWNKRAKKMKSDLEKEFKREIKELPESELDEEKLKRHIKRYKHDKKYLDSYKRRIESYEKAKLILDRLATRPPGTKMDFLEDYSKLVNRSGLFWSGSIYRSKNMVASKYRKFCEMVAEIKKNKNLPPEELFELCLKYKHLVKGLGVNVITEVMHTYNPNNCPVLNNSPVTSLRYFGITDYPQSNNFKPEHYLKFKHVMEYLRGVCELESLGMVDTYLNDVYWELKNTGELDNNE